MDQVIAAANSVHPPKPSTPPSAVVARSTQNEHETDSESASSASSSSYACVAENLTADDFTVVITIGP